MSRVNTRVNIDKVFSFKVTSFLNETYREFYNFIKISMKNSDIIMLIAMCALFIINTKGDMSL
jgi:hypothetical protein